MLGDVFVFLVRVAVIVSLSVYVWRAYRYFVKHETRPDRVARRREAKEAAIRSDPGATTTVGPRAAPAPAPRRAPKPSTAGTTGNRGGPDEPSEGSRVEAVIREELAKRRAATGDEAEADDAVEADGTVDAPSTSEPTGSARRGLFAPEPAALPRHRRTVADALVGIQLPCDLAPTIVDDRALDPFRAAFVTTSHPAREVGARLADELERLGYEVRSEDDHVAVARRPGADPAAEADEVRVEIYADAVAAQRGGVRLFPNAVGGSVAVQFTT